MHSKLCSATCQLHYDSISTYRQVFKEIAGTVAVLAERPHPRWPGGMPMVKSHSPTEMLIIA